MDLSIIRLERAGIARFFATAVRNVDRARLDRIPRVREIKTSPGGRYATRR